MVVVEKERWLGIGICRGRLRTGGGILRLLIAGEAEEIEADLHILIAGDTRLLNRCIFTCLLDLLKVDF